MICIDSDFIIDFLNGDEATKLIISKYSQEIVTTEINVFEIFLGIYGQKKINVHEEETARIFFNSIEVLSFDRGSGECSANLLADLIKKGKIIEEHNCFIAFIMLMKGYTKILTKNSKHFSRMKGIEIVNY